MKTPKERRRKVAHKPRPLKVVFWGMKGGWTIGLSPGAGMSESCKRPSFLTPEKYPPQGKPNPKAKEVVAHRTAILTMRKAIICTLPKRKRHRKIQKFTKITSPS